MISEYSGSLIKFKLTDHTPVMIVEFFLIGIYLIWLPLVLLFSCRIGSNNMQGCNYIEVRIGEAIFTERRSFWPYCKEHLDTWSPYFDILPSIAFQPSDLID